MNCFFIWNTWLPQREVNKETNPDRHSNKSYKGNWLVGRKEESDTLVPLYVSCVKQQNKTIVLRSRSFQVTQWPESSVSSHKAMVAIPPHKNRWDTLFRLSDRLFLLPAIILDVERTGSDWIGLFGWLNSSIGIRNSFTCSNSGWCIASPAAATHH